MPAIPHSATSYVLSCHYLCESKARFSIYKQRPAGPFCPFGRGGPYPVENKKVAPKEEVSAVRMQRLAEEMRFRIRESMAQRGGSEAFLHWLRSDTSKQA